jgi:hypothetical protein
LDNNDIDQDEFYMIFEDFKDRLKKEYRIEYKQISFCAGIMCIKK